MPCALWPARISTRGPVDPLPSVPDHFVSGSRAPHNITRPAGSSLDWGSVTELTLSHCGLKDVALLGQFRALAILKLDHNLLSELRGIEGCVHTVA